VSIEVFTIHQQGQHLVAPDHVDLKKEEVWIGYWWTSGIRNTPGYL